MHCFCNSYQAAVGSEARAAEGVGKTAQEIARSGARAASGTGGRELAAQDAQALAAAAAEGGADPGLGVLESAHGVVATTGGREGELVRVADAGVGGVENGVAFEEEARTDVEVFADGGVLGEAADIVEGARAIDGEGVGEEGCAQAECGAVGEGLLAAHLRVAVSTLDAGLARGAARGELAAVGGAAARVRDKGAREEREGRGVWQAHVLGEIDDGVNVGREEVGRKLARAAVPEVRRGDGADLEAVAACLSGGVVARGGVDDEAAREGAGLGVELVEEARKVGPGVAREDHEADARPGVLPRRLQRGRW